MAEEEKNKVEIDAEEKDQEAGGDNEKKKKRGPPPPLPEFIQHRIKMWDQLYEQQQIRLKALAEEKKKITVTLNDGKKIEGVAYVTTPLEIAKQLSNSLAARVIVAKVNDIAWDIERPLENDCSLSLLDFDSKEGTHTFWHSSAHILGQALERDYKDARLCIGPPVEEGGFYYDVYIGDQKVTPADYKMLEKTITEIQKAKQPFQRLVIKKEDALEMFKENQFKREIISSKVPDGASCTAYRCGPLVDLCKGPHVANTNVIKAMAVMKHGSSYWQGKADRESLQRVYGISFPDKERLKEHKDLIKKAEERDHRKVGLQQKLFIFHEWSPGCAFFLPHGTRIYNRLVDFMKKEYVKRGYSEVITPNVFSVELFKCSGHYDNYKENMFLFECENQEFGMKPMNCPGHCLIFGSAQRSYRELPLRLADFGVLHRNEISGALSGLTRVRRFQQDDAHIFCMHSQIEQEVRGVLDFMKFVYGKLGFTFHIQLSTRPEKFLGEIETWNKAEAALSTCLDLVFGNGSWTENKGDGAFYGPKIDIQISDALKRKFQCATIQLDFQLPMRFKLQYKNNEDHFDTPVIIHRAILGSVERMMAILVEHTGGKWPFWLSPRQAIIVPVGPSNIPYAEQVKDAIQDAGFFVEVDSSNRQLPKKVREAQLEGHNYILVVGDKEQNDKTVNVRKRDTQDHASDSISIDQLIDQFKQLTASFQ